MQGYFESYWNLETEHKPIRFGERDTKVSLFDLARRMLEVLYREQAPGAEIVGVEQPFDVPLIDLDTGEVLDRALVGTLDLVERDARGGLVVVNLKTAARKYTDLQVEASAPVRCADQDQAAGALSVLDDPRPRVQRAAVPAGGGDLTGRSSEECSTRIRDEASLQPSILRRRRTSAPPDHEGDSGCCAETRMKGCAEVT